MGLDKRSFGTHDGRFHADEVTACALLILCDRIDREKIYRTREPKMLEQCEYVCDVGGIYDPGKKLFDHHQAEYGEGLSSAGMVLRFLRDAGDLSASLFAWLDEELIFGVDAYDNGKELLGRGVATFSHVISNFNPIHYGATEEEERACFFQAVDFTIGYLNRLMGRYDYARSCLEIVKQAMESEEACLFFDEGIPWIENFFALGGESHPARFIIMPSGKHWKLRGIPPNLKRRMEVRTPLPAKWAGKLEEDLRKVCGIPGAIFCHKGRFISVWETKEDAIAALRVVLGGEKDE